MFKFDVFRIIRFLSSECKSVKFFSDEAADNKLSDGFSNSKSNSFEKFDPSSIDCSDKVELFFISGNTLKIIAEINVVDS